jgi:predicted amidohydrolase
MSSRFVIAAVQSLSVRGDVKRGIHEHEETVRRAVVHAVDSPGAKGCVIDVRGRSVGLAICADTTHPSHAEAAARNGATVYAAGVLITERGYEADAALMRRYAKDHRMAVIMANYGVTDDGRNAIGKSAVWDTEGELVVSAPEEGEALVIAETTGDGWTGRVVAL